jgi:hypothetical protein
MVLDPDQCAFCAKSDFHLKPRPGLVIKPLTGANPSVRVPQRAPESRLSEDRTTGRSDLNQLRRCLAVPGLHHTRISLGIMQTTLSKQYSVQRRNA